MSKMNKNSGLEPYPLDPYMVTESSCGALLQREKNPSDYNHAR